MGLLRFLADVTGLTHKIQQETLKDVGSRMQEYAPWFSGGIVHDERMIAVYNTLSLYGSYLKDGHFGLGGEACWTLRDKIYALKEKRHDE